MKKRGLLRQKSLTTAGAALLERLPAAPALLNALHSKLPLLLIQIKLAIYLALYHMFLKSVFLLRAAAWGCPTQSRGGGWWHWWRHGLGNGRWGHTRLWNRDWPFFLLSAVQPCVITRNAPDIRSSRWAEYPAKCAAWSFFNRGM